VENKRVLDSFFGFGKVEIIRGVKVCTQVNVNYDSTGIKVYKYTQYDIELGHRS
jgi:hypothetical protein